VRPKGTRRIGWCAGLLYAAWGASAAPGENDGAGAITLSTIVEKSEKTASGHETEKRGLVPLDVETPGDEIVYTVAFENTSARPVDNVRITSPIPPRMRYIENSAVGPGADVLYSVDGGNTYGKPSELLVATEEGIVHTASATEYTHLRWILKAPLEAGAKGFVRFRAVVR
jgi:uncharacterized repeat protein (TIGR01451 family)